MTLVRLLATTAAVPVLSLSGLMILAGIVALVNPRGPRAQAARVLFSSALAGIIQLVRGARPDRERDDVVR